MEKGLEINRKRIELIEKSLEHLKHYGFEIDKTQESKTIKTLGDVPDYSKIKWAPGW